MPHVPTSIQTLLHTTVAGVVMHSIKLEGHGPGSAGPDFVLVHGLGMSSRYMMPAAHVLAAHGTVHVPDLPGFGKSGKPRRTFNIQQQSDALAAWMETQELENPVLIGNSLGAQIVADCAARYPQRLRAAVLSAPTVDPEARTVSSQIFRLIRDMPREPAGLYWIALTDYFRAGWPVILETLHSALTHPILETLSAIPVPVLLINGGRDPIMPERWRNEAAHRIPRVRHVILPDAAHAVNFSAPHALVEEILQFLASPPALQGLQSLDPAESDHLPRENVRE